MDYRGNKMPSSSKQIEWYWTQCVREDIDFSKVKNNKMHFNFIKPMDFFELTEETADSIVSVGATLDFFSEPVALQEFEMNIFGDISMESQIGSLLSCVSRHDGGTTVYAIYAKYIYHQKSVYCAITVGIVDDDSGMETEIAVVEISKDEGAYVQPIVINENILYYFTFDDIMKLSYWLGDFWIGVQYKMNHCPQEIREVVQRGPISSNRENNVSNNRIILVKKTIAVDDEGKVIKYNKKGSGRQYTVPLWGVRGHWRRLPDGRETYIAPYSKGKERKHKEHYINRQYKFVDESDNGMG